MRIAAQVATVGLTLAISIAIGVFGGYWLDQKLKTNGILVIVGTLIGIIAGFKQLIQSVTRASREQDQMDAESRRERRDE